MSSLTPHAQVADPSLMSDAGPSPSPAMRRILALLQSRSPLSAKEISERAFVALTTLEGGGYLKKMKAMGLIRVEGWSKNHNGFTTPIYAPGAGPDCPRPKFQTKDRDSMGMARIVAVLECTANLGYRHIASLAGLSINTIKNGGYMEVLLKQGRVHISAWRRNRQGRPCPLYSFGKGRNVPEPAPLTRQEIMSRHRERKRALSTFSGSLQQQLKMLQA